MKHFAFLASALFALVLLTGCENPKGAAPAGTPTDPVETCAKMGQVCRYQGQQLGVCQFRDGSDPPTFVCVSQH